MGPLTAAAPKRWLANRCRRYPAPRALSVVSATRDSVFVRVLPVAWIPMQPLLADPRRPAQTSRPAQVCRCPSVPMMPRITDFVFRVRCRCRIVISKTRCGGAGSCPGQLPLHTGDYQRNKPKPASATQPETEILT